MNSQSAERAARGNPGRSFDGALQAAQEVRRADLVAEPEVPLCPITRIMFRDPVVVVESGHTYERSAVLSHFERDGAKDPITGRDLSSTTVTTNRTVRQIVQAWLDRHPDVTPDGWDCRELLEPSEDDVKVLRTWRAMCPKLQKRWPEDEQPEHWDGVTMENGRVVELKLEDVGLTDAVPAELGQLTSLKVLNLTQSADERAGGDRAARRR